MSLKQFFYKMGNQLPQSNQTNLSNTFSSNDPMTKLLKNGEYEYQQKDFIGEGAFAKVYKGIITSTQKVIAVRILPLNLIKKYGSKIKEIINGEVNVLLELAYSNDPDRMFTTKIYDCFLTENNVTMILQFCPDGNLDQIITQRGALSEAEAIQIVYQLARGIEFISKNNVVHRDIKPDNIFLKKEGSNILYKLGDFGFAVKKQINEQIVGTPIFMSPQIFREEAYGSEVDVWAFGLMIHYLLFKQYYFIGSSQSQIKKRVLNEQYKLKNHHLEVISSEMADFLTRCLKFHKKDRIKATQISKHPVFNKIRPKVQMLMQSVLKTSDISESSAKTNTPKGRMINYITSFNFIFDVASKLASSSPYNLTTLYLHKFNYSELTSIKHHLEKQQNFLGMDGWKEFITSQDYKQMMAYFEKIYSLNKKSFQDSYNTVLPMIASRYGPMIAKGIEQNLGKNPEESINPGVISYEIVKNVIPSLKDNNTPQNYCLTLQCMIVKTLTQKKYVNIDFTHLQMNKKTISLKERAQIYEKVLKQSQL